MAEEKTWMKITAEIPNVDTNGKCRAMVVIDSAGESERLPHLLCAVLNLMLDMAEHHTGTSREALIEFALTGAANSSSVLEDLSSEDLCLVNPPS